MIIRVMFKDEKYDMVNSSQLDTLILTGKIKKFMRSTGWVDIERDPIRLSSRSHPGLERRKK